MISKQEILLAAQGGACFYCSKPLYLRGATRGEGEPCTTDHFIPIGKNGSSGWENEVFACSLCNSGKGDRLPTDEEKRRFRTVRAKYDELYGEALQREKAKARV